LHGYGGDAFQLLTLAPELAGGQLLVVCPQAPLTAEGDEGYGWYRVVPGEVRDWDEFERMADGLLAFIDAALDRYPADRSRVALAGFSAGGRFAYRLALGHPERFAGLAALSTTLADEILERIRPSSELSRLQVLVQQGAYDVPVPVERGRQACERLRALGIEPEYHEYPMAHEIGPGSRRNLSRWLARVLTVDAPEASR
jgi:phospholipase/carboxylesterase